MAEANYTKKFKEALATEIASFLEKKQKQFNKKLKVETEYTVQLSNGTISKLDIAIINELDQGGERTPNRIVAIETEIKSQQLQIEKNYEQFKTFVDEKDTRVGSLIQLFTEKTNISKSKYAEIFCQSQKDEYDIKGFSYAMREFEVIDERTSKIMAAIIIDNKNFKRLLNKFIKKTHKVEYK